MGREKGFTLIELMIVVTVIAVLAAIAFPVYQNYTIKTANIACLGEAKAYANFALVALHSTESISEANPSACKTISPAIDFMTEVTATPKAPGTGIVVCDMSKTASCTWSEE